MAQIETNNVLDGFAGNTNALKTAGAPVDGTSGTQAGKAAKGAQLIDTTTGIVYSNTNTQASPTWVKVGTQV